MKRHLLLTFLLCSALCTYARCNGLFEHVIDVDAYSDWGKGYLTIIDTHVIFANNTEPIPLTWTIGENENNIPENGYIIIELNDKTAKNMTPEQFYAITDTASSFTIRVEDRKGQHADIRLNVIKEKLNIVDKYPSFRYFATANHKDSTDLANRDKLYSNIFSSISDENFDFQNIRTYDYILIGGDPLNDEKILDGLIKPLLERNTENPDIFFTIAKNADERVSATYVPPSSRTVNNGSYTRSVYNYFTKSYDYVTTQNNRTVNEGGYTQTTKTANIFLEIAALDAKRINDKTINHAPVIWQMTANRSVTNYNFKIADEYRAYAYWGCMPPHDRLGRERKVLYEVNGLIPDEENPSLVASVIAGSRAEEAGFQKGDIILKYEYETITKGNGWRTYYTHIVTPTKTKKKTHTIYDVYGLSDKRGGWTTKHSNGFNMILSLTDDDDARKNKVHCVVKRNGKNIELTLSPKQMYFTRYFWLNNEQLEQIRE